MVSSMSPTKNLHSPRAAPPRPILIETIPMLRIRRWRLRIRHVPAEGDPSQDGRRMPWRRGQSLLDQSLGVLHILLGRGGYLVQYARDERQSEARANVRRTRIQPESAFEAAHRSIKSLLGRTLRMIERSASPKDEVERAGICGRMRCFRSTSSRSSAMADPAGDAPAAGRTGRWPHTETVRPKGAYRLPNC